MTESKPAWDRDHSVSFAWAPGPAEHQRSRLARLIEVAGLTSLDEFRRQSATDPAWFWQQMIEQIGVVWKSPPSRTLDLSRGREFATFFPDAGFNYTEQALDHWIENGRADHPAIVWEGEEGSTRTLTYLQLLAEVSKASHGLAALGVRRGDRVGIFMPLIVECAVAMLACSRVGAIFTPIFSGFGASAVATRLNDCDASVLITVDGAYRRGK
ncbi:MAG TPA: AMP-dependent synthetase, partial [Chloroflexi bacterium]|nr:AMP-dependent synthetase [Chloroflexota bacterium]